MFSATNFCLYYRAAADVGANSNLKLHSLAKISLQWCAGARARRDGSGNTGTVGKIQCGDGASLWSQQSLPPHEPAPPYKNLQELQSYQTLQKIIFSNSLLRYLHSIEDKELWDIYMYVVVWLFFLHGKKTLLLKWTNCLVPADKSIRVLMHWSQAQVTGQCKSNKDLLSLRNKIKKVVQIT